MIYLNFITRFTGYIAKSRTMRVGGVTLVFCYFYYVLYTLYHNLLIGFMCRRIVLVSFYLLRLKCITAQHFRVHIGY